MQEDGVEFDGKRGKRVADKLVRKQRHPKYRDDLKQFNNNYPNR